MMTIAMTVPTNRTAVSLTVEAPITTPVDDILEYFCIVFQRKLVMIFCVQEYFCIVFQRK